MIYDNILDLIGKTPIVRLNKISQGLGAEILVKLEYFNPGGSVKDRVGYNMIKTAENSGLINKDTLLIEPTSGNTGVGLAMVAARKGYKLILTMPENMSIERRKLLSSFGAEIVLTEKAKGMQGAIEKAVEIKNKNKNSYIFQQFENEANPGIHEQTTAKEILEDTEGQIDIFIACIGTGGTLSGIGRVLKAKNKNIKVYGVEPEESPLLSEGRSGVHGIQGIGANFVPRVLNKDVIDHIIKVKTEDSFEIARILAKEEGILAGISSGAAVKAALILANDPSNKGKRIVTILPDSGERYLSVL
ncbi:cysteine synthase [Desulfonispora thiosulfatigenes DSM 11270]|uniref:Cysteine synthase n=1 Tax=Desulfonispora thiosulfatigenes DSM 11270 TaxID=656914 RepID=A0A1W1UTU6_DESTI|nr:cysteine synthase A [Desulfonispora thiosulfatigenes]SMB84527.1 cysteine synthase [Desulfonispora thiosulfatigenes DSM 11270]